jgi:hypothetical protein
MVVLVIWPKNFSLASERFFGGRITNKQNRSNLSFAGKKNSTQISGLSNPNRSDSNMQNSSLNGSVRLSQLKLQIESDDDNRDTSTYSAEMQRP